jgi:hypothetical protein
MEDNYINKEKGGKDSFHHKKSFLTYIIVLMGHTILTFVYQAKLNVNKQSYGVQAVNLRG